MDVWTSGRGERDPGLLRANFINSAQFLLICTNTSTYVQAPASSLHSIRSMSIVGVRASFWRGGTSRGLIFRARDLAPFSPLARENIIRTALGSPDLGGRQIDGLGGGVSSLSKVAVVGLPGEAQSEQRVLGRLPGAAWADLGRKDGLGEWDIVYRFAQVGVKDPGLDWCEQALSTSRNAGPLISCVGVGQPHAAICFRQ